MQTNEYESKLNSLADLAVLDRSLVTIPMYFLLLLAVVFATPISHRFPQGMFYFGAFSLLLCISRFWIVRAWKKNYPNKETVWRKLFLSTYYITSLSWGIFCCLTVVYLELGWTSFFVLLITIGICAASVPTLSPKFSLSKWHLILMFLPSLLATVFYVGGLKGYALAAFFLGFFLLLLMQSKVQNVEYWTAIKEHTRLQAMIDALPGTLSWVSSDLKYLGVNQHLTNLWHFKPETFIGNKIGFSDKKSSLKDFVKDLFDSDQEQKSKEFSVDVEGEKRTYYMVANKYNQNTEAVILGMDFTEYQKTLEELTFRKEQSRRVAKLASLGEISGDLAGEIRAPALQMKETIEALRGGLFEGRANALEAADKLYAEAAKLNKLSKVLELFSSHDKEQTKQKTPLADIIDAALSLCSERFKTKNVNINYEKISNDIQINCYFNQILEVILNLLNNAFDAIKNSYDPWVKIEIKQMEFGIEIAITDSGNGIPEEVKNKIFQPFFSTKELDNSTGVGLSNSREIIEKHGGILALDSTSKNTRFTISFSNIEGKIEFSEIDGAA